MEFLTARDTACSRVAAKEVSHQSETVVSQTGTSLCLCFVLDSDCTRTMTDLCIPTRSFDIIFRAHLYISSSQLLIWPPPFHILCCLSRRQFLSKPQPCTHCISLRSLSLFSWCSFSIFPAGLVFKASHISLFVLYDIAETVAR